jgi:hypothetical protein
MRALGQGGTGGTWWKRSLAVAGTVSVILTGTAGAALASGGTSSSTNGCYSTWGNTGSNFHCPRVTVSGNYQNHLACNGEADKTSSWYWLSAGSSADNLGQLNCRFKASSAYVAFRG